MMRKFIVHTRPVSGYPDGLKVVEVECELVSGIEDQSIMWLPEGEFKVHITEPKFLLEAGKDGKLSPPIYYGHALYICFGDAWGAAQQMVHDELKRRERKQGIPFSYEEYGAKCADIQDIRLQR